MNRRASGSDESPAARDDSELGHVAAALQELERVRARNLSAGGPDAYEVRFVDLLKRHGHVCRPQPRPKGVRKGAAKACFLNAHTLSGASASSARTLTYTEGWVWATKGRSFPVLHAWCIDDDLNVVDPTLPKPQDFTFVGIPLDRKVVWQFFRDEFGGQAGSVLDHLVSRRRENEIEALLERRFQIEKAN